MDNFGIGNAVKGALAILFQGARRTGRTTAMINHLRDGDRILFVEPMAAHRFESICKEHGLKVECLVIEPGRWPERITELRQIKDRYFFDHSWIEKFYTNHIYNAERELGHIQEILSHKSRAMPMPPMEIFHPELSEKFGRIR